MMKSLNEVFSENYADEVANLSEWCEEIYNNFFSGCYDMMNDIKHKLKVMDNGFVYGKLSEFDLERIITELPMDLYTASESINKLRLELEMIKLKYKRIRREVLKESEKDENFDSQDKLSEHELLIKAYESVITRAENERSSCRELIMGAKKIWDSRRSAEHSNPIGETNTDLPDYKEVARNQYVK